jgi:hypothetical protein
VDGNSQAIARCAVVIGKFVLITAAKNEAQYIGTVIESVLRQRARPIAWYIVDDASTDETAAIVHDFARAYSFIRLERIPDGGRRGFDSKDRAISMAYEKARAIDFSFVGVQDADIAPMCDDYYQRVLDEFSSRPRLGIAGGYVYERTGNAWRPRKSNSIDSVAGGIQLFRRECYESIGGYTPLNLGGEDWLAQLEARRQGWKVAALPECPVYHFRTTSSASGRIRGLFRLGMMDASFGSALTFELFKCVRRISEAPVLAGSIVRLCGFAWWKATCHEPVIPRETVAFLRREQMERVYRLFRKRGNRSPSDGGVGSRST